jgi:cold shock CspA family protein
VSQIGKRKLSADAERSDILSTPVELGTVAFWHAEEGWGAVEVPGRPGVGFAHFSHIRGIDGYRELYTGQPVEVEWADDFGQDGCQWRVASVRPVDRAL